MNNFLSSKAAAITPYTAGAQPVGSGIIKINTNENPYPPSPKVFEALSAFDADRLRLYPRPDGGMLRSAVAAQNGVPETHVFCGNGSDEVLGFAFYAFFDGNILFPDITYSFYPVWASLYGLSYQTVALNADFTVAADALYGGGVVLANPNAPTGIALEPNAIEGILVRNSEHVVIVDEAYAVFGAQSVIPLVQKYPNLLVVTTLSKSHGLAGLRVAYAIGQPHLIDGLERVKDSFNSYPLDTIAQIAASAALKDTAYCTQTAQKIIATRERTAERLAELGFLVLPSKANFLFVTHPRFAAADIKAYLEQNSIFVRHFNLPRISNYLRISIGTDAQMDTVVSCLIKLLHKA